MLVYQRVVSFVRGFSCLSKEQMYMFVDLVHLYMRHILYSICSSDVIHFACEYMAKVLLYTPAH